MVLEEVYICRHGFRCVPLSFSCVLPPPSRRAVVVRLVIVRLPSTPSELTLGPPHWHCSLSWETSVWKSPTGIPRDPPLSSHGVDQAKELAAFLKRELGVSSAQDAKAKGIVLLSRCVQSSPVAFGRN